MGVALTKLVWLIFKPGNALVFAIGVSALLWVRTKHTWALRLFVASITALFIIGFTPVSYWLAAPLEHRHPNTDMPDQIVGLIVLSGYERSTLSASHNLPQTAEGAERLLAGAMLAHQFPDAPIILSGGGSGTEPEVMTGKRFLNGIGIDDKRIRLERASRNTYENAHLSRPLAREGGPWVLITSAVHMPRALKTFRATGWNVIPHSTDFITDQGGGYDGFSMNAAENISLFNRVSKEWIGLMLYTLKGHFKHAPALGRQS